jgi:hypothetical protein
LELVLGLLGLTLIVEFGAYLKCCTCFLLLVSCSTLIEAFSSSLLQTVQFDVEGTLDKLLGLADPFVELELRYHCPSDQGTGERLVLWHVVYACAVCTLIVACVLRVCIQVNVSNGSLELCNHSLKVGFQLVHVWQESLCLSMRIKVRAILAISGEGVESLTC